MLINLGPPLRVVIFVFFFAFCSASFGQAVPAPAARVMSLNTCIEKALAENPALKASARRWEAAQARARQARAIPNPRFEVSVENFGGRSEYTGVGAMESTLSLSQEVELGGKRGARTTLAAAESAVAQAEYESRKLDILRDTRRAFIAVLLAQEKLRLAEDAMRLAKEIEKTTAMRVAAGKTTALESDRVGVETARVWLAHDDAARELTLARQALAGLWGASDSVFKAAEGVLDDGQVGLPPLKSLLAGLARTPDIARSQAAILSAQSRIRAEKAERIPNVEFSAGLRRFEDTGDSAFVAGVGMELPLFNRNAGGIRAAVADLDAVRLDASAVLTGLTLELRQLYASFQSQERRIETLKGVGLPTAERALAAAQIGYREGKFGYLEVLDMQRVYTELRVEYAEALAELRVGLANVQRLSGSSLQPFETK